MIGHEILQVTGCGILLTRGDALLLQLRKDTGQWCIPGGLMELGETFLECAVREVYEETGLAVRSAQLFGIYSGREFFGQYPNGDKTYSPNIIFLSDDFSGESRPDEIETQLIRFFERTGLPDNIVDCQKHWICDWANKKQPVIVK